MAESKRISVGNSCLGSVVGLANVKLLCDNVWKPQKQTAGTLVVY